jgi:hypothetical protein
MRSPHRTRTGKKLLLALLVFVAALVACELGLRVVLAIRGTPYSAWRTKEAVERAAEGIAAYVPRGPTGEIGTALNGSGANGPGADGDGADGAGAIDRSTHFVLHPYSGSEAWPDTGGVLQYFRELARPDDYKVVVMGGSVAQSLAARMRSKLPEILRDDPALRGRRIAVLDYAHATYKQPQQTTRLVYLLSLGYRPDAVIEIDGFNEVTFGPENAGSGTNPVYPAAPVWSYQARDFGPSRATDTAILARMVVLRARMFDVADQTASWHLYESSWLGRLELARVAQLGTEYLRLQRNLKASQEQQISEGMRRQLYGPEFDHEPAASMATSVRCWFENALMLQEICAGRGIRYVHILQPTLYDTGSKPMSKEEAELQLPSQYWCSGPRDGYPLLRARIGELRAKGVRFIDASRVFADVQETVYVDTCHLSREGERVWLERMAPDLRAALCDP